MTKYLLKDMANILENLRNRSEGALRMTQDRNLVEQIDAIKKSTHVDTTLAILLHSNHFDSSWNPNIDKKLQEEIDKRYSFKKDSYKNIEDIIFNYLNGWIIEEDIFWQFYGPGGEELNYDPTDGADKLIITYLLTQKIKSIFPVEDKKAFNLANDFINYKIEEYELENKKFYPRPNQLMEGVLNEHEEIRLNPSVKPGDHIRLISLDYDALPPGEYEDNYTTPEHLELGKVDEVYQDEAPNGEEVTMIRVYFPRLETSMDEEGWPHGYSDISDDGIRLLVDPYDKYVKTDEVLTEGGIIGGNDGKSRPAIADNLRKNLVRARFERPGGWGRPRHIFILYITPTGKIMDISYGAHTSKSVSPFEMDQKVTFGELYKFEQDSPFDLRMFGRLREQDEQLSLFPTGTWEFPVGWDEESIEEVIEGVPEKTIPYIFKQWDEHGIEFRDLKLLGIQVTSDIAVFLLKRYLQNTNQPVIAGKVFDCDDLTNLFNTQSNDYNLDYIKEFLCGDAGFWDSEDWYNYEWDEYMTDQIDENNWKTISEIFGGVSQSVAEDILNRSSSSEEVDELIEKYDEEIGDIQSYIVWTHNDEHEWAIKEGMRQDILDKLAAHFQADGELYRSDEDGSYSWHFEDDLRNWVNDGITWDNIERFEFHPDYAGTTLEDSLIDTSPEYLNEKTLFAALIDEEYMFHDYCEGKKGDCLEVDTTFFDGYWHPNYDINSSLEERLGELTYEPTITSPEGETGPVQEQQSIWGNGVIDREKEWCEDDDDWLCNTGSENLGFSDLYKDDGHDIIHSLPGNVHLSDMSPEEKETRIPNSEKKKRFKKLRMNPDLGVVPFNIPVESIK